MRITWAFDARGRVVLVRYSGIATGAWMECRRLSDGSLVWTADVARLHVSHSEYWNSVRAWLRGDTVVLVGVEAQGGYVQSFDRNTGAQRFAIMRSNDPSRDPWREQANRRAFPSTRGTVSPLRRSTRPRVDSSVSHLSKAL